MELREHFAVFTEYERGWGSDTFHVVGCKTKEDAMKRVNECNAENTAPTAPDCYIQAEYSTDLNWLKHKNYVQAKD